MDAAKKIAIVIPSFRDERILDAIASVRTFDDAGITRLIVIDGGSAPELVERIAKVLTPADTLVSEPDQGIFDGLNKGLDAVDTPYMGWIGSDDLYTGTISSSEVAGALETADLFVTSMAFFREDRIRRITHSWPSRFGLCYYGLHNPHYGTFGRSALLTSERFAVDDPISDQVFFFRIFGRKPKVVVSNRIGVLAGEGGFSNSSYTKVLRLNGLLFKAYRRHTNVAAAALGLIVKVAYKGTMRLYFKARHVEWATRYPLARAAMTVALPPVLEQAAARRGAES